MFQIRRMGPQIGVEVTGVDVKTIDRASWSKIYQAWLDHNVMVVPDAEYHHVWRKGDVVIWDNRCSYHKAAGDYPPEEDRIHWRVSINDYGIEALEVAE